MRDQLFLGRFLECPEAQQARIESKFADELRFADGLFCLTADSGDSEFPGAHPANRTLTLALSPKGERETLSLKFCDGELQHRAKEADSWVTNRELGGV